MKSILILILFLFSLTSYSQVFYGYDVCDFNQGPNNIGGPVSILRSDSSRALYSPENIDIETGTINFVSLGFGGDITLKLQSKYSINATTTFGIYETTYIYDDCDVYGEIAQIYLSSDNIDYVYLGETCLNSNTLFDVSQTGLDSIQYIKVIDISEASSFNKFSFVSDGYDLDGIEIFDNGPLPIILKYFGIEYDKNLSIKFITTSEANTDIFIVQSSIDLKNFEDVTTFKGFGYSTFERMYYKTLIFEPKSNITYFRLVEVDYNGNIYNYDIIPVNTEKSKIDNYYYDLLGRRVTGGTGYKLKTSN